MKKLIIITIVIVGICFAVVEIKFKSGSSSKTESNDSSHQQAAVSDDQSQAFPADENADQPKKLVVSDEELAKLKKQNVVSPDEKYYIKQASPFPKIVNLETGDEYVFRPSANYSKISKLSWSGDSQTLVYIYQVPDPDYAGAELLNTADIKDVVNQKFPNAARVLVAAGKLDYVWYDAQKVLYSELQNYDATRKFYANGTIGIYDVNEEEFSYPLQSGEFLNNLYSINLSAGASKFLYTQAKLNDLGSTVGQQYVVSSLDGQIESTSDTYNSNWYK